MESVSVKHEDGTIDTCQRARAEALLDSLRLEQLYWDEVRRLTLGSARFSRDAVRLLGVWPTLLRFGPSVDGRREILGGLIARRPGGAIVWRTDGAHASVAVEGFAPRLRGRLWRLQSFFHDVAGRRFLARIAREVR